jgi:hypothetical protein
MGSYADSLLSQGERVIMRQRQHWLSLVLDSRLALALWAGTILLVLLIALSDPSGTLREIVYVLVLLTLLGGLIVVAWRWWEWRAQEFLVTNRRLLNTSGIINKRSADSSLEKINDAVLEVNLIGRLLDYGDLKILTAAETGIDRYHMLSHATAFKKAMMNAKHQLQSGDGSDGEDYAPSSRPAPAAPGAPAPGPVPPPPAIDVSGGSDPLKADTPDEIAAVLAELTRLRDAGHISSGEYEIKKQELLDRL